MIVTYGLFTADKFELPVMYADSLRGLSIRSNIPLTTLYCSLTRGSVIRGRYKVEKVIL